MVKLQFFTLISLTFAVLFVRSFLIHSGGKRFDILFGFGAIFKVNHFLCFSIAVSRSKNVPPFGPTFAKDARFEKSSAFRDFLLVKGLFLFLISFNGNTHFCLTGLFFWS